MIEFILLVNKQGQTRLAKYYGYKEQKIRVAMEAEIVRKCLARADNQVMYFGSLQFQFFILTSIAYKLIEERISNIYSHIYKSIICIIKNLKIA